MRACIDNCRRGTCACEVPLPALQAICVTIKGRRAMVRLLALIILTVVSGKICQAQDSATPPGPPAPNAVVVVDSLAVYAEMSKSTPVIESLKKGEQVMLAFEFKTTERWCSITLASQALGYGYVPCEGLERIAPVPPPASDAPSSADGGIPSHAGPANPPSKDVSLPPPSARQVSGYDQIAAQVVREDAIDVAKMNEFDAAARTGVSTRMWRAAIAHFAAGKFELSRDNADDAVAQFQSSLNFSAGNSDLQVANLLTLAYIDLMRSQYSAALEYLGRAHRLMPISAAVAQLSGWAYYGLNQIDDAVKEWQAAQRIAPSPEVERALAKAQRDQTEESAARETNSGHFNLRYQGSATPQLAQDILSALDEDYSILESAFHFTPPEPIGVVLYTEQGFRDVSELPGWAGAENDGRIRVPVQGLTSVTDLLSRELRHELVHSFVRQKTLGRCPVWLNEGLAQWFEGRRSDYSAKALVSTYEAGNYISLQHLEGSWSAMPGRTASFAYAWSLAAVENIMATSGTYGIQRLFDRFDADPTFESALRSALQTDYADLERQTVAYLRQTYP
jgi:predicted negative regulator of RcsB-dependent stress response